MYLADMSHTQIIFLWPSLSDFAGDLDIAYGTAKAMRRRGSIPAPYWPRLVAKAAERDLEGVTLEVLAESAARGVAA